MDELATYRAALLQSWHHLLDDWPGADVRTGDGWAAARCPDPVLSNAILDAPAGLPELLAHVRDYRGGWSRYAVWTLTAATAEAASAAGLVAAEATVPMLCRLPDRRLGPRPDRLPDRPSDHPSDHRPDLRPDRRHRLGPPAPDGPVRCDGDPAELASLNGLPRDFLRHATELRCYLTPDGGSGLAVLGGPPHANVSMVVTRPELRGRGLATRVLSAALDDLVAAGYRTASLQATDAGQGVYARVGFHPVGRVQEWMPPTAGDHPEG